MKPVSLNDTIQPSIKDNIEFLAGILPLEKSYDVLQRDLIIGEKQSVLYYINGLTESDTTQDIMEVFGQVKKDEMPFNATGFIKMTIPYLSVKTETTYDKLLKNLLSGVVCLLVDGYDECITIDCRTYPGRGIEEPDKDKSLRGSRDGFVENIVCNTALMRRRIRDPHLIMQMVEVGDSSRTDVAVCYMSDRVDQALLDNLMQRIDSVRVKGEDLRMNQQTLAEELFKRKWFNPFPKFKFTERPDTATVCLLEGKVVILVDNSPSAMVLPTSIIDMIEEPNDYYFAPITGFYLKFTRTLINLCTVFVTPIFLMLMMNPEWVPKAFAFIAVKDAVNVPLIFQLLILELAIDGLRLAALNTPSMLSTPLSVIAGLVMGEFSVKSGWFNAEVMLYMAFVAVANYSQPNFELGYALKFMRLQLLILTACLNWIGFIIGCIIIVCSIAFNKTLSGRSYLAVSKN